MSFSIIEIKQQLKHIAETHAHEILSVKIKKTEEFLSLVRGHVEELLALTENLNKNNIDSDALRVLEGISSANKQQADALMDAKTFFPNVAVLFPEFSSQIKHLVDQLELTREEVQTEYRFAGLQEDTALISGIKLLKRTARIFRKDWKHTIPLKNLVSHFTSDSLGEIIRKGTYQTSQFCCVQVFSVFAISQEVEKKLINFLEGDNSEEIFEIKETLSALAASRKEFEDGKSTLEEEFSKMLTASLEKLEMQYHKVGTLELSAGWFADADVIDASKRFKQGLLDTSEGWFNTWLVLTDEWLLLTELNGILYQAMLAAHIQPKSLRNHVSTQVTSVFKAIELEINRTKQNIEGMLEKGFIEQLEKERDKLKTSLKNDLIPQCKEGIINGSVSNLLSSTHSQLLSEIISLQEKRAIAEGSAFDRPIANDDIQYISAKELLDLDVTTVLQRVDVLVADQLEQAVEVVKADLADVAQMTDFGLKSAISASEEVDINESRKISLEGLDRAIEKINHTQNTLTQLVEYSEKQLVELKERLLHDIGRVTETDRVFDLKLWMIRAKAEKKTLSFFEKIKESTVAFIPEAIKKIKKIGRVGGESLTEITDRFRLIPKEKTISNEVSHFLSETQKSIEQLPYVYRRLFKIEPLEDQLFFQGRSAELLELGNAYTSWRQGRFAPTAIIGEKISGGTSVINIFFKTTEKSFEILRCKFVNPVYEEPHFFKVMADMFNCEKGFENMQEVISYVNDLPAKKVVLLEDLEHLFLKKVNGFNCLKIFLEIMSKTNQKIFWVNTCCLYSWNYLNKTVQIADYYGHLIVLGKLKDTQIVDIIKRRHRVSGYKLFFQPTESDLESKKFKKLPKEEQQQELEHRYFSELKHFAQSNIGLALLFWLRSATGLSDGTISITSKINRDMSFLKTLGMSRVFTLHALLIHDGLTIEAHSLVLNKSISDSRLVLTLMLEDGLVHENQGLYFINPLIYRQTVSLLKDKNLLH